MPVSPATVTSCPAPCDASSASANSRSISASRPIGGGAGAPERSRAGRSGGADAGLTAETVSESAAPPSSAVASAPWKALAEP